MTAKVPYPRQLAASETLDTLTHWKSHIRNYFRRDENLKIFFARENTWDQSRDLYGFTGEGAATKADYLEGLLDTVAGFMPGPYLTARITKQANSMQDVFNIIWTHYDVDPNPSTFLDFAELELSRDERYIDLFYRMLYHAEMHLLKRGTVIEGKAVEADETLSFSHKNLIALNWMQTLDSHLLAIVKLEKHQDLKDGKQLFTMVNDIAKNVDEWLKRHGFKPPTRSQDSIQVEPQVRNVRFEGYNKPVHRGANRGHFRGQSNRGNRGSFNRSNSRYPSNNQQQTGHQRRFCPGCNYLSQELHLEVNFQHYPSECPRKKSVLRILRSQEQNLDEEDGIEDESLPEEEVHQEDDYEGTGSQKIIVNNLCNVADTPWTVPITQLSVKIEDEECLNDDNRDEMKCQTQNIYDEPMTYDDTVELNVNSSFKDSSVKNTENDFSQINAVWKAKSPTINVYIKDQPVTAIIDEGSEISAISYDIAHALKLSISRTVEEAQAAGSTSLQIIGKTAQDILVKKNVKSSHIVWNLGQCLVVNNLGCDILIGEPAKAMNSILTHPVSKSITTVDNMSNKVVLSYSSSQDYSIVSDEQNSNVKNAENSSTVRLSKTENIYPQHSVSIPVPKEFKSHSEVLVECTEKSNFPAPGIHSVHHGMIKLENSGSNIERLHENDILVFSPLRKLNVATPPSAKFRILKSNDDIQHSQSSLDHDCGIQKNTRANQNIWNSRKIYDINENHMNQFVYPHNIVQGDPSVLDSVSIDPDNRLSGEHRAMFGDIIHSFNDIITKVPGRYNGFYGQVNCALTLTANPPPSLKPRLPNYSDEKLNILAKLIDDMEEWGVVSKPEKIGVVPTHIHPCILVPKDDGKYRLVTDFRSIQSHVRQMPTVMPTTSEAMTALSSADFHIELDFSNYYWQNAIPREDSEKLAIFHPFGGLRVYTVCPQGLRNSAEWGSEILARIYGDMVQNKQCTRIADQIYVLGNSVTELMQNFKTVMTRARNANLTFKPSKIIVCPQTTVILGWKKCGSEWAPTEHVLSPLSKAEPPSTVKKLRGWLGAYRQIAKTIPNHSVVLQKFEKLVGGKNSRDKIAWSPDLLEAFDKAKDSIATSSSITIPRASDKLKIFPDWSQDADAIGGRLIIERVIDGKKTDLHGGEFSCRLKGAQSRWTPCEKECLAIKLLVQHYQPFIRESNEKTTIFTDNIVSVHAWNAIKLGKISTSSRVASFISTMCENNIDIVHFPGTLTKVADYNSRHPVSCNLEKCQTCRFVQKEIDTHQFYVRFTHKVKDDVLLVERPTWLELQKQDSMLAKLHQLIKTGSAPEKKSRNRNLKLLHNMYRRGTVFIASDGLLQVKNVDVTHGVEYNAIIVPEVYISSLIQSLHLKSNHPSPYQLHKTMSRHFFAIGIAKLINNITAACDVCTRLKTLPKQPHESTTTMNDTFGSRFSADILIEKGQRILLCREKLSQFTTTCFLSDETQSSIEEGIIMSLLDLIPENGAIVQVDPGPSLVAAAKDENSLLLNYNIKLDIGRVHNKQKNPIAENAIKEFRKEWLRFKPEGSSLSELERTQITAIMNKRIRLNGLAPKEFVLKRNLKNHDPIAVNDPLEGSKQFDRRTEVNAKQFVRDSVTKLSASPQTLKTGDLVYIVADLSKSRGREQYVVTKCFMKDQQQWITARKWQKGLRNKEYLLKASEVFLAPLTTGLLEDSDNEDDDFQGFQENIQLDTRQKIKQLINTLEKETNRPSRRGRPARQFYPDYLNKLPSDVVISEEDEIFFGFSDNEIGSAKHKKQDLQKIIKQMENSDSDRDQCYGFSSEEVLEAQKKKDLIDHMLAETRWLVTKMANNKIRKVPSKCTYSWDYQQWLQILDQDYFEESIVPTNRIIQVPLNVDEPVEQDEPLHEEDIISVQDLSYDNTFLSFENSTNQTFTNMADVNLATLHDFNVHFEKHGSDASTPKRFNLKSVTNPSILDKIPLVTTSESSLDSENSFDSTRSLSSSVFMSPLPAGPVRLDTMLEKVHQECPELSIPDQNKVYNMERILANIHEYDNASADRECSS